MKTNNIIFQTLSLWCMVIATTLVACDADMVERSGGKLPDKGDLTDIHGFLRSNTVTGNEASVMMTAGSGSMVEEPIYYLFSKPVENEQTFTVRADESLVNAFNTAHGSQLNMLPESHFTFPNGATLTVAKGVQRSATIKIRIDESGLEVGDYLLPLTVTSKGAEPENGWQTLYYRVNIRQPQLGDGELNADKVFAVFYLNTSLYDPRLVDDYYIKKEDATTWEEVWYRTIGNIVNLRTVFIDYDAATERAKLNMTSDMKHISANLTTYIRPLQDKGRKVCICIEGGGKGLGFCNMSDAQIDDFTAQVKAVVNEYGFDGVNLWDRNSGYDKEGMPEVNTTSYPKLIVALRKALGKDKLLTLTDHLEPTEYFWDTTATGGIEVGKFIDFAWSGYCNNEMLTQIIDPWHQEAENVCTEFPRKPIAGLDPSRYGCINIPWYKGSSTNQSYKHIFLWRQVGNKQSDILVFEDIRTLLQDEYEGSWQLSVGGGYQNFADDGITGSYELIPGLGIWIDTSEMNYSFDIAKLQNTSDPTGNRYNKWLKNW